MEFSLVEKSRMCFVKSILLYSDSYKDIKYGIKLGYKNIGFNGKFYTFPYFLTFLLKR